MSYSSAILDITLPISAYLGFWHYLTMIQVRVIQINESLVLFYLACWDPRMDSDL